MEKKQTFSPFVYPLNELAGKTLGIVGLGNIGKAVAKIANAFDMNVIASSRTPKILTESKMFHLTNFLKQATL